MKPLVIVTVCFVIGTLILHHLPALPPHGLLFFYPLIMLLLGFILWHVPRMRAVSLVLLSAVLGFALAHGQAARLLQQRLAPEYIGKDLTVRGTIDSLPQQNSRRTRFELKVSQMFAPGLTRDTQTMPPLILYPTRLRLNWYRYDGPPLQVGDEWQFTVRLKPPRNFANPNGYDYSGGLLQKGILYTGYVRDRAGPRLLRSATTPYSVQRWRQSLSQQIQQGDLPAHATPFLRALLNGDRADLSAEDWQVLQQTGTTHLMAISGLHVGLIAGLVFFMMRYLWCLWPQLCEYFAAQRAAAIAAWCAALLYAALAGFSIPTQRALIMLSILLIFVVLQKPARPLLVLCYSLLAVLLYDSFAVLAVGFWLSFFAVGLIYSILALRHLSMPRWRRWLHLQILISLGLLPLTVLFFQQAPVASPLANLVAIPVIGFVVVPLCFAGAALLLLAPALAQGCFYLAAQVFEALWAYLAWLAHSGLASFALASPSWPVLLVSLCGLALWLLPPVFRLRALALVCLLPLLFPAHPRPPDGEARLSLLDVGQGLAAVVQTRRHTLVFDTGPAFSKQFDTGRAVILPFLHGQGVRHIDTLVVSHGDNDHIGGAHSIAAAMPVGQWLSSVPDRLQRRIHGPLRAQRCQRGQHWQYDGVQFRVLHPAAEDYATGLSENNLSCVLQIRTATQRLLLTGDIEAPAEALLLQREVADLQSHVLVVPHHGSRTSSTAGFVAAIQPRLALLPTGWRNRYRFPHASVVQTYIRQGVPLVSTAEQGALIYDTASQQLQGYRRTHRSYWESP